MPTTPHIRKLRQYSSSLVVTIPAELIARLGWHEGDHLILDIDDGYKVVVIRKVEMERRDRGQTL